MMSSLRSLIVSDNDDDDDDFIFTDQAGKFILGFMNCLLVAYVFVCHLEHFWILYAIERHCTIGTFVGS